MGFYALALTVFSLLISLLAVPSTGFAQAGDEGHQWSSCSSRDARSECPGPIRTARYMHTATLLDGSSCNKASAPDFCGKVLIAGGDDDFCVECSPYASAELYDPSVGEWKATAGMRSARTNHTATMLPNGRVLVVGGLGAGSGFVAAAEVYEPAKATWSEGEAKFGLGRFYHTATPIGGGKVLVAGGTTLETTHPGLNSAFVYNSARNRWTQTKKMVEARGHHAATALEDGTVLVTGGFDTKKGLLSSAEIYYPKTNRWREVRRMSTKRLSHSASLLPNGEVLVVGGTRRSVQTTDGPEVEFLRSTEIFDPKTKRWRSGPEMQTGHAAHTATTLKNGDILVVGGSRPFSLATGPASVAAAEVFDTRKNKWSPAGELNTARGLHTATLLDGPSCRIDAAAPYCGRVLIAGGGDSKNTESNALDTEGSAELSPAGLEPKSFGLGTILWTTLVIVGAAVALVMLRRRSKTNGT